MILFTLEKLFKQGIYIGYKKKAVTTPPFSPRNFIQQHTMDNDVIDTKILLLIS